MMDRPFGRLNSQQYYFYGVLGGASAGAFVKGEDMIAAVAFIALVIGFFIPAGKKDASSEQRLANIALMKHQLANLTEIISRSHRDIVTLGERSRQISDVVGGMMEGEYECKKRKKKINPRGNGGNL